MLGPGIYLDMATVFYDNNLPDAFSNHTEPLLNPYKKLFIGGSHAPHQIVGNTPYHVTFLSTQPGQADQDNAELTLTHSKTDCWLPFGCTSGAYCNIHDSLFGLEPIPGRIDWQPAPARCSEWSSWFLPLLKK